MKQVEQQTYYNQFTSEEKTEYINYVERRIIRDRVKNPLHYKMYKVVKKTVKSYLADFFLHDFNSLTIDTEGSTRFVWIVGKSGTHLLRLDNDFSENRMIRIENFYAIKNHNSRETDLVYIIDLENETLKKSSFENIAERMFTAKYGTITEYFLSRTAKFDIPEFNKMKKEFDSLMTEYRQYPPKGKVDAIIDTKPSKRKMNQLLFKTDRNLQLH